MVGTERRDDIIIAGWNGHALRYSCSHTRPLSELCRRHGAVSRTLLSNALRSSSRETTSRKCIVLLQDLGLFDSSTRRNLLLSLRISQVRTPPLAHRSASASMVVPCPVATVAGNSPVLATANDGAGDRRRLCSYFGKWFGLNLCTAVCAKVTRINARGSTTSNLSLFIKLNALFECFSRAGPF